MDRHNCFMHCIIEINDDLLDEDSCKSLLGAHGGAWRIPGCRQVVGQRQQAFSIDLRPRSYIFVHSSETLFQLIDALQSYVPTRLQFTSNQALRGVDSLVPARSK
jgi:hypothetical protein